LDQDENLALPVTGLLPIDALNLCHFLGGRLPSDAEWDAAAADCGSQDERARFPWACGDNTDALPTCLQGSLATAAANHQEAGTPCPARLLSVASYPASGKIPPGGEGALFDLAGNAGEWTLPQVVDPDASTLESWRALDPPFIPDVAGVFVRGGDFRSGSVLLENDFRFHLDTGSPGDLDALRRAADRTGFRCVYPAETPLQNDPDTCPDR
jgi:formylglycine-generating enzyme required for sulfatase activity